uniref:Xin actin binding repeat containing 2 n=1 Tax=Amphiprion percula TaxID=161767 RepID=A0A3P8TQQ7_AMPPE
MKEEHIQVKSEVITTESKDDANSQQQKAVQKHAKDSQKKGSELCTVCRRRAYPMDALIVDKKKYHKSCFCCEHCRNKLSLGNYVSLHGHFYCLHHYKQLLKSKGNYDNGLGNSSCKRPDNKVVGTHLTCSNILSSLSLSNPNQLHILLHVISLLSLFVFVN